MKIKHQKGVVLIEFAFGFLVFWIIFFGILEFARAMVAWNAAGEATRVAARMASMCTSDDQTQIDVIKTRVTPLMRLSGQVKYYPNGSDVGVDLGDATDWLKLEYFPVGCSDSDCEQVQASLSEMIIRLNFLGFDVDLTLPDNRTTVMRETMRNDFPTGYTPTNKLCSAV